MSEWYQAGLTLDLDTLTAAGALGAMLLDDSYAFDPTDEMADVALVESSGGAYTRQDVDGVVLDVSAPEVVRLMTSLPVSFPRPTSTPGFVVVYRTSDDALIAVMPFVDDAADPLVVYFTDDVIVSRYAAPPTTVVGGNARIVNTDGDPGETIYVGSIEPTNPPYDLVAGDVWIEPTPPGP